MCGQKVLFVLCGNARTFADCFDSCYRHVISRLCDGIEKPSVYLYLKTDDPGPKWIPAWNFSYDDADAGKILSCLEKYRGCFDKAYANFLRGNEISDDALLSQVAYRFSFVESLYRDHLLLRSMHCHYNFEVCGKRIEEIERDEAAAHDVYVYIRPDLFFFQDCAPLREYRDDVVSIGNSGIGNLACDLISIVPRRFFREFFFDRMQVYRTKNSKTFSCNEMVFYETIPSVAARIGVYTIKRQHVIADGSGNPP
jgi:hypothetical protein